MGNEDRINDADERQKMITDAIEHPTDNEGLDRGGNEQAKRIKDAIKHHITNAKWDGRKHWGKWFFNKEDNSLDFWFVNPNGVLLPKCGGIEVHLDRVTGFLGGPGSDSIEDWANHMSQRFITDRDRLHLIEGLCALYNAGLCVKKSTNTNGTASSDYNTYLDAADVAISLDRASGTNELTASVWRNPAPRKTEDDPEIMEAMEWIRNLPGRAESKPARPHSLNEKVTSWSEIPSSELWDAILQFHAGGDKHFAEMEFRKEMRKRNIPSGTVEDMLKTYLNEDSSDDFETRSLLEIYEQDSQGEHIIPNILIAGQVTIVHGKSGSGKSTLVKQAVRSVLIGEPFIDRPVVKGNVLFVELDEPTSWTAETLIDKMGLPKDDARRLRIVSGLPAGEGIGSLKKYLGNNSDVRLVVIDTLQTFCQVENINDNSEVGRVMQGVRDLLKVHNDTAVLFIHHSNKSGGFLGAQIIMGSCDILYKFEMDPEKELTNRLICEKWRTIQKQPPVTLQWDQTTHLYKEILTLGPAKQKLAAEAARQESIISHLKTRNGKSTQPAIFEDDSIKGDQKTIRASLQAIERDGVITREELKGMPTVVKLRPSSWEQP